jgi:type IV secretion system protein VirB6
VGFFAQFFVWLQAQLGAYIGATAANVAAAITPAAVTLGTIYIMVWGWLSLTGRIEEPFLEGLRRVLLLAVVFGVGLKLWAYAPVFVDTFARSPQVLAAHIIGAADPVAIVDQIWSNAQGAAEALQHQAGIVNGLQAYIGSLLIYVLVGLLCLYTAFLLALSQIAVAVLLAVGPVFVTLLLFNATRRFFESWLAQLANYALVTVLVALIGGLLLKVVQSYAATAAAAGDGITVAESVRLCAAAVFIFLILRQVLSIAAGLASGVALSTFSTVSRALSGVSGVATRSADLFQGGPTNAGLRGYGSLLRQAGYPAKRGVQAAARSPRPPTWTERTPPRGGTS